MPKQSKSAWEALLGDATIDIDKADFIEARAAAAKSPRKLGAPSATGGSRPTSFTNLNKDRQPREVSNVPEANNFNREQPKDSPRQASQSSLEALGGKSFDLSSLLTSRQSPASIHKVVRTELDSNDDFSDIIQLSDAAEQLRKPMMFPGLSKFSLASRSKEKKSAPKMQGSMDFDKMTATASLTHLSSRPASAAQVSTSSKFSSRDFDDLISVTSPTRKSFEVKSAPVDDFDEIAAMADAAEKLRKPLKLSSSVSKASKSNLVSKSSSDFDEVTATVPHSGIFRKSSNVSAPTSKERSSSVPGSSDFDEITAMTKGSDYSRKPLKLSASLISKSKSTAESGSVDFNDIEALAAESGQLRKPLMLNAPKIAASSPSDDFDEMASLANESENTRYQLKLSQPSFESTKKDAPTEASDRKLSKPESTKRSRNSDKELPAPPKDRRQSKEKSTRPVHSPRNSASKRPEDQGTTLATAESSKSGSKSTLSSMSRQSTSLEDILMNLPGNKNFAKKGDKLDFSLDELADLEDFLNDDDATVTRKAAKILSGSYAPTKSTAFVKENDAPKNEIKDKKSPAATMTKSIPVNSSKLDFGLSGKYSTETLRDFMLASSKTLTHLSLSQCQLTSVPEEVANLDQLVLLNLSHNQIKDLPEFLGKLKLIETLDLRRNLVEVLPLSLAKCRKLRKLALSNNQLCGVATLWPALNHVTDLDVASNRLSSLRFLNNMIVLEKLNFSYNKITDAEIDLSNITNLHVLVCKRNSLTRLPTSVDSLKSLQLLDLSENRLTSCSFAKNSLSELTTLILRKNKLTDLSAFTGCVALEMMDVRENPIESLPPSLANLESMTEFLMDVDTESSVKFPPLSICQDGWIGIVSFMQEVIRGTADPKLSFAYGPGLSKQCDVCETESFTIKAVDRFGNQKKTGNDPFKVVIEIFNGDALVQTMKSGDGSVSVRDVGDGSYFVNYNAKRAGKYTMNLLLNNQHINESPLIVQMVPATAVGSTSSIEGQIGKVVADADTEMIFSPKDSFGNPCDCAVRDINLRLESQTPSSTVTDVRFTCKSDIGSKKINFAVKRAGEYLLHITLNCAAISGSPIPLIVVPSLVDPSACEVTISGNSVEVNAQNTIQVLARDCFANGCSIEITNLAPEIKGPDQNLVTCDIINSPTLGTYFIVFVPTQAGRHSCIIKVKVNNEWRILRGRAFDFFAVENTDLKLSEIRRENGLLMTSLAGTNNQLKSAANEIADLKLKLESAKQTQAAACSKSVLTCPVQDFEQLIDHLFSGLSKIMFIEPFSAEVICACARDCVSSKNIGAAVSLFENALKKLISLSKESSSSDTSIALMSNLLHLTCEVRLLPSGVSATLVTQFVAECERQFRDVVKGVQNGLSPFIVNAFLEQNSAQAKKGYFKTVRPLSGKSKTKTALESVLAAITEAHQAAVKYCVNTVVIEQMFSQIFFFINSVLMNSLLLRQNLCDVDNVRQIRDNVAQLEEWAESAKFYSVISRLGHIRSAADLLQLPLNTMSAEEFSSTLRSMTSLNIFQVDKLIRFVESRVSPAILKCINEDLVNNSDSSATVQIFLDTFAAMPFTLEGVEMDEFSVPSSYDIPYVLKRK